MRQNLTFLVSALALITMSRTQCLIDSPDTAGVAVGEPFSNREEIEALGPADHVLFSFKTCTDGNDDVIGLQYTLVSKTDFYASESVPLKAIGTLQGRCSSLQLSGPIEKVKASYSGNYNAINSIKYYKGEKGKTYGTLLQPNVQWEFAETNQLIGLRGYVEGGKITQLSFITYTTDDSLCPVVKEKGSTEEATEDPGDEGNSKETTEDPVDEGTSEGSTESTDDVSEAENEQSPPQDEPEADDDGNTATEAESDDPASDPLAPSPSKSEPDTNISDNEKVSNTKGFEEKEDDRGYDIWIFAGAVVLLLILLTVVFCMVCPKRSSDSLRVKRKFGESSSVEMADTVNPDKNKRRRQPQDEETPSNRNTTPAGNANEDSKFNRE